jgi:hypothetical protein
VFIKQAIGGFCASAGLLFLVINAVILARGAAKWGFDPTERIAYGAVAATVPFVIASMPFLIHASWKPGRLDARWGVGRPSLLTAIGAGIWLVFVAYNLAGAAGSVALVREDVVSTRKHAASNLQADEAMRERLTKEINAVPQYRPAAVVGALLAARKAAPEWGRTEKCTDVRRGRDQKFCNEVTGLEIELASAKRSAELNAQLGTLTSKLETRQTTSASADPAAEIISTFTGLDERYVSKRLPLATPIVLELGSMTLLYFAFVMLGFCHNAVSQAQEPRRSPSAGITVVREHKRMLPVVPRPTLTRQQELAQWFFRECVRPMATGSMPETDWYRHYTEVCRESDDTPLPVTSFRRFAEKCTSLQIEQVDGVCFYLGALPYVPRRAA